MCRIYQYGSLLWQNIKDSKVFTVIRARAGVQSLRRGPSFYPIRPQCMSYFQYSRSYTL